MKVELPLPPLPAQRRIAEELDRICELKRTAEKLVEKYRLLIKAKFSEMFGDVRVNEKNWTISILSDHIVHANNGMTRRGNDECGSIVLRIVELRAGYIDYSNVNRISVTDQEKTRYLLMPNDCLFVRVNGNPDYVGRCAFFKDIGEPVYHNDHIIRVRLDKKINPTYLSELMNSSYGKSEIRGKLKTSAGQYTINQDGLGLVVVPLPPLALQREFAAFVEKVEKLEQAAKATVEKYDLLYRSKLQEYFG